MKKAFQDMLHGLGEVNPTHAYYNGSRTSKDNEDPSWNTSFKMRRTQKTTSAMKALWKTKLSYPIPEAPVAPPGQQVPPAAAAAHAA
ncbi:hypothetical protein Tco_0433005 [Tanacetum coccineum]